MNSICEDCYLYQECLWHKRVRDEDKHLVKQIYCPYFDDDPLTKEEEDDVEASMDDLAHGRFTTIDSTASIDEFLKAMLEDDNE